jgi:hypothetical protein
VRKAFKREQLAAARDDEVDFPFQTPLLVSGCPSVVREER